MTEYPKRPLLERLEPQLHDLSQLAPAALTHDSTLDLLTAHAFGNAFALRVDPQDEEHIRTACVSAAAETGVQLEIGGLLRQLTLRLGKRRALREDADADDGLQILVTFDVRVNATKDGQHWSSIFSRHL